MPEEVLFEVERRETRGDIAAYLHRVADALEGGESVTLSAGEQSITMDPPERPTFEVKAEREGPTGEPGELSIEFEIEWDENGGDDGELQIE